MTFMLMEYLIKHFVFFCCFPRKKLVMNIHQLVRTGQCEIVLIGPAKASLKIFCSSFLF